jgi:hypothetical protein
VQIAKLVLVNAQAYTEGVGEMATLPKLLAYIGVSVLKSVPVRFYANTLIFTGATYSFLLDAMRVIPFLSIFCIKHNDLELLFLFIGVCCSF